MDESLKGNKMEAAPEVPIRDQSGDGIGLLIIDMINHFDFDGGEDLKQKATTIANAILNLRRNVELRGWPVIYVNDNFGKWHSERSTLVKRALEGGNPMGGSIVPKVQDYFIIKPQFSGFYATNLPVLLPKLGVSRLIITGIQTDICVLFTAADAHMRDYALWIPEDRVASSDSQRGRAALDMMRTAMSAETRRTDGLTPSQWSASFSLPAGQA